MGRYPYTIDYSKTYSDDNFEYRHVHLTKSVFLTMHVMTACKRLLTETEWRGLGVVPDKHGKFASIKTSQQQTEKNKSRRVYCRKAIGPCAFGCATSSGRDSRKTTKFLLDPSNKSRYLCQMHYLREWKKLRQPVAKCITVPP